MLKLTNFATDIWKLIKHNMLLKSLLWIGSSSHKASWKAESVLLVLASVFYTFDNMGSKWL